MIAIKKNKSQHYSIWLWLLFWGLIALCSLGNIIIGLWYAIVFFACKPFFERWAAELGKSPSIPFVIVLLFGLPGHLGYYIYYRSVRK